MQALRTCHHPHTAHGVPRTAAAAARLAPLRAVSSQAQPAVTQLLALIEGTERGLNTPEQVQASIMASVEQLKAAQAGKRTTDAAELSATWKVWWQGS